MIYKVRKIGPYNPQIHDNEETEEIITADGFHINHSGAIDFYIRNVEGEVEDVIIYAIPDGYWKEVKKV